MAKSARIPVTVEIVTARYPGTRSDAFGIKEQYTGTSRRRVHVVGPIESRPEPQRFRGEYLGVFTDQGEPLGIHPICGSYVNGAHGLHWCCAPPGHDRAPESSGHYSHRSKMEAEDCTSHGSANSDRPLAVTHTVTIPPGVNEMKITQINNGLGGPGMNFSGLGGAVGGGRAYGGTTVQEQLLTLRLAEVMGERDALQLRLDAADSQRIHQLGRMDRVRRIANRRYEETVALKEEIEQLREAARQAVQGDYREAGWIEAVDQFGNRLKRPMYLKQGDETEWTK